MLNNRALEIILISIITSSLTACLIINIKTKKLTDLINKQAVYFMNEIKNKTIDVIRNRK